MKYEQFLITALLLMWEVFFNISKAIDKVWHIGFIFKLKFYGVDGELLSLLKNYLQNREQKIV